MCQGSSRRFRNAVAFSIEILAIQSQPEQMSVAGNDDVGLAGDAASKHRSLSGLRGRRRPGPPVEFYDATRAI